jgi:membrane protein YqaA with SNARE-associated domain
MPNKHLTTFCRTYLKYGKTIGPMHKIVVLIAKYSAMLTAVFTPLGIWGVGLLALIDSGSLPIPIDIIVAVYVWEHRSHFLLYCLVASFGSMLGSLVPYYIGRAGGELFLLKRIQRERFESLRDRFERQEFLAVMVPAMMPPPTPIKLFELAAGVFEMRILAYAGAIFLGRFIRFTAVSLLTIFYGPDIIKIVLNTLLRHGWMVTGASAAIVVLLAIYIKSRMRKKPASGHEVVSEKA